MRAELGIEKAAFVILFVGRFTDWKRPYDCIETVGRLRDQGVSVHLVLVGDGPLRWCLESQARAGGLEQQVHFAGFINQGSLVHYYTDSDVFLLASSMDQSPKALNEAMVFGLPIVCSDGVGTVGELVWHGDNGFVFPKGDVSAMVEYLRTVVGDRSLREGMGKRSREIVSDWNFDSGVQNLVKALDSLNQGSSSPE
jgi:glycosyltransferase involved in cell wall biosynthesis